MLNIPDPFKPGIRGFVELSDREHQALMEAFSSTRPQLNLLKLGNHISQSLPELKLRDVLDILDALLPLFVIQESTGLTDEQLAREFADAVFQAGVIEDKEMLVKLQARTVGLLACKQVLGVTAKANNVLTRHQKIFHTSRIVTDIRPIFIEVTESPKAAVLVHNLQITYHEDSEHREFYVALDLEDLEQLQETINRARLKAETLKSFLSTSSIPDLS